MPDLPTTNDEWPDQEWTADDWDADWDAGTGGDGHPDAFLVSQFEDLELGTSVDLGCGAGVHTHWLAERGWRGLATAAFRVADTAAWTPDARYDLFYSS